ncbi:MAG: YggT family protein [Heliobacteriaceae bacterium]|jgi:YggT family protein|nr:YggT family protein [Heliobacteriaceae bacterium]
MAYAINNLFNLYFFLIILRVFLTWIPSIRWETQPWLTLREVTDIWLNLFRRFIPPLGGLDISPIVALIVLQILQALVLYIIAGVSS